MRSPIERQRGIIDFTLSSLMRRKVKNVGLLCLYALIVFILASAIFFTSSIKKEASLILRGTPEIIVQKMAAGRHDLFPLRDMEAVKNVRGVAAVEGRLWGYYFDDRLGANYTLIVPPAARSSAEPSEARPLFWFNAAALEPGTIVIGEGVARVGKLSKGDSIAFTAYDGSTIDLKVADTLSSKSELVSSDLILIGEEDFRKLFDIGKDYATDITVEVKNPREIPTVASKITRVLPDTRPIVRDEILRTYDSIFNWRGGMMIVILSAAILAFVIFAWDKASGLSAEERQEIGILKAVGWETSDVILMKFWEGAIVSLTAYFAGVILAYVHVFLTGSLIFEPALKGWSVLYPHFSLTPFISAEQLITLFFLTVVPYTIATIVPTWRAAIIDPDAAMRQTGE